MQNRWLAFDPLNAFWAGVLICYVEQAVSHSETLISWHDLKTFESSLWWILFGLASVVIGYELRLGRSICGKLPVPPARLNRTRLAWTAILLTSAGIIGYWYDMSLAGGLERWLSVPRGGADLEVANTYVLQLEHLLPVGVALGLFIVEMFKPTMAVRLSVWILGALMWLWFVYLGTRSRTIMFSVTMMAAFFMPQKRNPPLPLLMASIVGLLVLSNFMGHYRSYFRGLSFNLQLIDFDEAKARSLPKWLGGGFSDVPDEPGKGIELNCVMSVIRLVPETVPYNFGYGHLEVFTRPIPRSFWQKKPYPHLESIQGVLREAELSEAEGGFSDLLAGPAFTFVGHWYYVAGGAGLLLGGLLTGVMFRAIRSFYDRDTGSHGGLIIYLNLLLIGFSEAAATPFYWIFTLPFSLAPLLIALQYCRERQYKKPKPRPERYCQPTDAG
jgi:hypothetical protein